MPAVYAEAMQRGSNKQQQPKERKEKKKERDVQSKMMMMPLQGRPCRAMPPPSSSSSLRETRLGVLADGRLFDDRLYVRTCKERTFFHNNIIC